MQTQMSSRIGDVGLEVLEAFRVIFTAESGSIARVGDATGGDGVG